MRKRQLRTFQRRILQPTIALFLSATVILTLSSCSKEEKAVQQEVIRPAKILTITAGGASQTRKYPAKVKGLDRVEVSFEVSGKLIELPVKAGQEVKKGDLIGRLDPQDYQSKYEAALSRANQAKAELGRYANLLKEKVVAKSNYDVKKRNYDVAAADVKIAKKALDDTKLKAHFSGRVGRRFVENFQVVQAKQAIVTLQKVGAIDIIVNAPERAMAESKKREKIGLHAEFSAQPGKRYPLTLKEFSTEADPQTQTYRVVLTMPTPTDVNILDGMTATVFHTFTLATGGDNSIEIPSQAVFSDEKGQSYVWSVGDDMRVKRLPVVVGVLKGTNIEVLSGLESDHRIVTAGIQNLVEGQKIRPFTGTVGE